MNGPFPSCSETHYESEALCKVFIMKISFHIKELFSKETVVRRRWGVETNVWFISRVDKPNICNLNMFFCSDFSSGIEWNYHNVVFSFFQVIGSIWFLTRKAKVNTLGNVL